MVTWVARAAQAAPSVAGSSRSSASRATASGGARGAVRRLRRSDGAARHRTRRDAGRGGVSGARGPLLIVNGDLPNLEPATLRALVALHRKSKAVLTLVTTERRRRRPATGGSCGTRRGAVIAHRRAQGRDAAPSARSPRSTAASTAPTPSALLTSLKKLRPNNAQGEYYLTDAVHALIAKGETVVALQARGLRRASSGSTPAPSSPPPERCSTRARPPSSGRRGHAARPVAHVDRSARDGRPRHACCYPGRHRRGALRRSARTASSVRARASPTWCSAAASR